MENLKLYKLHTVAGELILTVHGRTARPPICTTILVLFLVVNCVSDVVESIFWFPGPLAVK